MHRGSRYVAGLCAAATAIALSGYGVRADVPQVPTGTWASAGSSETFRRTPRRRCFLTEDWSSPVAWTAMDNHSR